MELEHRAKMPQIQMEFREYMNCIANFGGQGNRPKPRPKIQGTQWKWRVEKQKSKPLPPPKPIEKKKLPT